MKYKNKLRIKRIIRKIKDFLLHPIGKEEFIPERIAYRKIKRLLQGNKRAIYREIHILSKCLKVSNTSSKQLIEVK